MFFILSACGPFPISILVIRSGYCCIYGWPQSACRSVLSHKGSAFLLRAMQDADTLKRNTAEAQYPSE